MGDLRPRYIEIDTGIEKLAGVDAGRIFWIDLVDTDGGRLGLWFGHNYDEAIEIAEKNRLAWELDEPVRDLVGGAA